MAGFRIQIQILRQRNCITMGFNQRRFHGNRLRHWPISLSGRLYRIQIQIQLYFVVSCANLYLTYVNVC